MRLRGALIGSLGVAMVVLASGAQSHWLVERWKNPEFEHRRFENVIVVAIAPDDEARRNFENLFVSHLRGKQIGAVTSYSLVPDLADDDEGVRKALIALIDEQKIDGVISVRTVPLKNVGEDQWGVDWRRQIDESQTLRQLIEESLPLDHTVSKKHGVEVALWGVRESTRIWAARTNRYTLKQMRNGGPEFVDLTMHALEVADLMKGISSR